MLENKLRAPDRSMPASQASEVLYEPTCFHTVPAIQGFLDAGWLGFWRLVPDATTLLSPDYVIVVNLTESLSGLPSSAKPAGQRHKFASLCPEPEVPVISLRNMRPRTYAPCDWSKDGVQICIFDCCW